MPDNKTKEYDETIVSACPHCFSSTHTIIDENKIGDFCGKCGKDKSIEDNKTILEDKVKEIIDGLDDLVVEFKLHGEEFTEPFCFDSKEHWGTLINYLKKNITKALSDKEREVKKLITDEIGICHKEGTPTSRLTSLFNKI